MKRFKQSRRDVLKTSSAAAASAFCLGSPRTASASEPRSKNDRLSVGVVGAGNIGTKNMDAAKPWLDIVAIADVDAGRRDALNHKLAGGRADVFEDYRHVIHRDDVDVIHIATPDHWHAKPLVEAMLAGKDVYCEKPLTLTIDEGKLIRRIQQETGRVVQVGTQQRSMFDLFVKAMAIVADGRLGRIRQVQAAIDGAPSSPALPVANVPEDLNWNLWLGPCPEVDYRFLSPRDSGGNAHSNCHYEFRWWYEYSGGKLTDWGAHHVDICHWALRLNGQTQGPISVSGTAKHPVEFTRGVPIQRDRYNTATEFHFKIAYPGGTEMVIRHDTDNGVLITGENGRIFVNRRKLVGKPVEDLQHHPLPDDAIAKVYQGLPIEKGIGARPAHWANFVHCVRERKEPISDVHSHMEMLNICHLAGISARLGRSLRWDNRTEMIAGDDQANGFLARPYRKGFEIEMASPA